MKGKQVFKYILSYILFGTKIGTPEKNIEKYKKRDNNIKIKSQIQKNNLVIKNKMKGKQKCY